MPGPSRAQAQTLALDWDAPAACPDGTSVRTRALAMLEKSSTKAQAAQAEGRIETRAAQHRLTLRIEVDGQIAERKLEADDCEVLAETAAWLIALAIDPSVPPPPAKPAKSPAVTPSAPEKEAQPAPKPKDQSPPSEEAKPATQQPAETSESAVARGPALQDLAAHALGGVWVAGLAGPMASVGGRLSLRVRGVDVGLRVNHRIVRGKSVSSETAVEFSSTELALFACRGFGDRVRAGPCLGLAGQQLRGAGRRVDEALETSLFWLGLDLGGALHVRLWRGLELLVLSGINLPLTARPVFQVTGVGSVGEVNLVSVFANLGVGVRLP
jgi:hypothetical protein